jgi:hypothetical protein
MLGVRAPDDILPDEKGLVGNGKGGLSVAPNSMWNVPPHRRPKSTGRGSTGKLGDYVYAVASFSLPADKLTVRLDPDRPQKHAFVEPAAWVHVTECEANLASTGSEWRLAWH